MPEITTTKFESPSSCRLQTASHSESDDNFSSPHPVHLTRNHMLSVPSSQPGSESTGYSNSQFNTSGMDSTQSDVQAQSLQPGESSAYFKLDELEPDAQDDVMADLLEQKPDSSESATSHTDPHHLLSANLHAISTDQQQSQQVGHLHLLPTHRNLVMVNYCSIISINVQ